MAAHIMASVWAMLAPGAIPIVTFSSMAHPFCLSYRHFAAKPYKSLACIPKQ
jgi:hypothetical protein